MRLARLGIWLGRAVEEGGPDAAFLQPGPALKCAERGGRLWSAHAIDRTAGEAAPGELNLGFDPGLDRPRILLRGGRGLGLETP